MLRFNYRVQVSRMMTVPFCESRRVPAVTSVPDNVAHSDSSSQVTVSTKTSLLTSLSLTRIHLSCLRAIDIKHH
jgi:hypothetical protein